MVSRAVSKVETNLSLCTAFKDRATKSVAATIAYPCTLNPLVLSAIVCCIKQGNAKAYDSFEHRDLPGDAEGANFGTTPTQLITSDGIWFLV